MILADLTALPIGSIVQYDGEPAIIREQNFYTHYIYTHILEDKSKKDVYFKAWVVVFDRGGKQVTLFSQYPRPKELELTNITPL